LPSGEYKISAGISSEYGSMYIYQDSITLAKGQSISYSLFGETSTEYYLNLIIKNIQYLFFGIGIILIVVWRKDII
jgi:hypothetical protein